MTAFRYEALDAAGGRIVGRIEADGARTARQSLRARGLIPVAVEAAEPTPAAAAGKPALSMLRAGRRVFSRTELAIVTTQTGALLRAGLPLAEALATLAGMLPQRRQAALILSMRDRIAEGATLAQALAGHPASFPAYYVAAVAAGEEAGGLPLVLERLARHVERSATLRRELVSALFYPVLIALVAAVVVMVLFTFVVPQLAEVFADNNAELPALTQAVLATSRIATGHGAAIGLGLLGLAGGLAAALRSPAGQAAADGLLLALPFAGTLYRRLVLASFVRTLAIVVGCGQPVAEALSLAGPVVRSPKLQAACTTAAEAVGHGESLRAALERTGVFPPLVLGLVATGEAAGALAAMLDHAAGLEESDLHARLATLVKLVEPVLILVVGAVVLTVVLAVLVPILDLNRLMSV